MQGGGGGGSRTLLYLRVDKGSKEKDKDPKDKEEDIEDLVTGFREADDSRHEEIDLSTQRISALLLLRANGKAVRATQQQVGEFCCGSPVP